MLIYSMSVEEDGFIADREGGFGWTVPTRSTRQRPSQCPARRGAANDPSMTSRFSSNLVRGIIVATSVLTAACSSGGAERSAPLVGVETSTAPATPDTPGTLPTANELTALYNTALDYDVPLSDRVNLIQGVDEADPRLAQKFVQEEMTVAFHAVLDRGDGSLLAFGNPS
ncbi:hypothetical protein [Rhodococcus opacus]|uniref:Low molecular weight antigen MTB12-like C-terminal domain-containing protein n=1 Tax=Rhodococcus opacus (strain B4) TaxID=632772 RepID=C1ARR5_RHOOB|nr:hypothetical protein [Rhodococcus opacus]BAH48742.1 hypothetical protein ROP_04950 [Rhodococcus opacus B4]